MVNHLLDLLAEARKLAENLKEYNEENALHLYWATDEALAEKRPLTIPERRAEAKQQISLFRLIERNLESAETTIGLIY